MSRAVIKRRVLPDAPNPTKPQYVNNVQGIRPEHLEVRPYRPPVILEGRPKKRRMPSEAVVESARLKHEARERRKSEAIRMYNEGVALNEIAEQLGVKLNAVYEYTRYIRESPKKWKTYEHDDDIIRMYKEGMTYKQIAEALGTNRANIADKLKRLRRQGKVVGRKSWECIQH